MSLAEKTAPRDENTFQLTPEVPEKTEDKSNTPQVTKLNE